MNGDSRLALTNFGPGSVINNATINVSFNASQNYQIGTPVGSSNLTE